MDSHTHTKIALSLRYVPGPAGEGPGLQQALLRCQCYRQRWLGATRLPRCVLMSAWLCNPMHPDCNPMHPSCPVLCFSGAARCDCATRRLSSGKRRRLRQRGAGARVGPQGKAIGYRPRPLDGRPMYRKALTLLPPAHALRSPPNLPPQHDRVRRRVRQQDNEYDIPRGKEYISRDRARTRDAALAAARLAAARFAAVA
eukprot:scaffold96993_cov84-Phaeocystis_antarctica.AAC.1